MSDEQHPRLQCLDCEHGQVSSRREWRIVTCTSTGYGSWYNLGWDTTPTEPPYWCPLLQQPVLPGMEAGR